ncbi:hypothetical protein PanWU01x14_061720 [Parasponia andersonii]|uniref:DUF7054 domain-containing protein n=1 Tax=Parasponia andersonii TaxID=3476 RepID=A0A2P5DI90_PARAD|nr:hypothetical protein PanWU01x14_061720 [Parasponia andersonii]
MFQLKQQKKKNHQKTNDGLMLICVTVLGSAGPIRLVVDEDELVASVICAALKSYARQGRLPVLGSDLSGFLLYCSNDTGTDSLSPLDKIGSQRARNFILYKKPSPSPDEPLMMKKSVSKENPASAAAVSCRGRWIWKSWIKTK